MRAWQLLVILVSCIILVCILVTLTFFAFACVRGFKLGFYKRIDSKFAEFRKDKAKMTELQKEFDEQNFKEVKIQSRDKITLYGRYLNRNSEKTMIFFNAYRGNSKQDYLHMLRFYKSLEYNLLFVDQRAHGKSKGVVITFGVKEKYDVVDWVEYVREYYNPREIILVGISMGASTVLMASDIVDNHLVKGIIADCGYTSIYNVLTQTLEAIAMPSKFALKCISFWLYIFKHVKLINADTTNAVARTDIPILYIHGVADKFIPSAMSEDNYNSTNTYSSLLLVDRAGHAGSYICDKRKYEYTVKEFLYTIENE